MRWGSCGQDFAFRVAGAAGGAEADDGSISFFGQLDAGRQSRRRPDAEHENALGEGVERPGVSDLCFWRKAPPQAGDHVVTGRSGGLVDVEKTEHIAGDYIIGRPGSMERKKKTKKIPFRPRRLMFTPSLGR